MSNEHVVPGEGGVRGAVDEQKLNAEQQKQQQGFQTPVKANNKNNNNNAQDPISPPETPEDSSLNNFGYNPLAINGRDVSNPSLLQSKDKFKTTPIGQQTPDSVIPIKKIGGQKNSLMDMSYYKEVSTKGRNEEKKTSNGRYYNESPVKISPNEYNKDMHKFEHPKVAPEGGITVDTSFF